MTGERDPAAGRVLALDVGLRRTGLALSDPSRTLASPLETVTLGLRALLTHICELIRAHEVKLVLIGHPELRTQRSTEPARLAEELAERLRARTDVAVRFWDETLTSWEATGLLERSAGARRRRTVGRRRPPKGAIDRVAATLILQDYLDAQQGPRPAAPEPE
jgi:putative Holliday junction resolvase